jgi:hypothetical protein
MKMRNFMLAFILSLISATAFAQSPTFVTSASNPVGTPIPITVYLAGSPVTPDTISWSGPAGVACSPTATGFNCVANAIGSYVMKATHSSGTYANLTLMFTAGLQFVRQ